MKTFFGFLYFIWIFLVVHAVTFIYFILFAWLVFLPQHKYDKWKQQYPGKIWNFLIFRCCLLPRVKIVGKEKIHELKGGVFGIISNHRSTIDTIALIHLYGYMFIMKFSLIWTPIGIGAWVLGCITTKRGSARDYKSLLRVLNKKLAYKVPIFFFPEGTRNQGDGILPFKKGLLAHYYQKNIPLLIIAMSGTDKIHKKNNLAVYPFQSINIHVKGFIYPHKFSTRENFISACHQEMSCAYEQALLL